MRTKMTNNDILSYIATDALPVVAIAAPKNGVCGIETPIDVQAHAEVIQAGNIEHWSGDCKEERQEGI